MRRFSLLALLAVAVGRLAAAQAQAGNAQRPNVVLIITDDVGYGDFGSYGAPDIKTPHIDGLARDGVRLTDFYANGATCTPTRTGLISGRYQQRFALERPLSGSSRQGTGLPVTGRSLPQLLKRNGYATALVGKWHLGWKAEFSPSAHGFDYFFGFKSGYIDYYQHTASDGQPDLFENDRPVEVPGYMTDLITERSVRFIEQNAQRPFFIDVAYNAAHWPYQPPDMPSTARDNARHLGPFDDSTSTRADYVAMLEHADQGVGRILGARQARSATEHDRDLHQRQRRRMVVAQHAALPPQGDGVGRRHPGAGDPPLAGTHSAGQRLGPGRDHDGPDRLDSRRDTDAGAGRGAPRRHRPVARARRTRAGDRAHAVLARDRRAPATGRPLRRLEAALRRRRALLFNVRTDLGNGTT